MALPIKLSDIHFGERDALHEFLKQDRLNLQILENSFVMPPRIKIEELLKGAKFLVVGPKGSGKTTLLWYLRQKSFDSRTKLVLFKSDLRKEDRDRLDHLVGFVVVQDQKKFKVEADYKTVWEWYLLRNIFRLINPEDVIEGDIVYRDIISLLDIQGNKSNTIYDNFHVEKIKGRIKLAVGYGPLKSEMGAEVEAKHKDGSIEFLDLVRLIQSGLEKLKLRDRVSIRLYIDEIEFFMSKDGDGERDRRLVRDLIFSMDAINRQFGLAKIDAAILACIRTEIISSINGNGQEIEKIVDAYGVNLNWFNRDLQKNPVIGIFSNKMRFSEIESEGAYSEDGWKVYFPPEIEGKEMKAYLLDLGLHRPRGVVLRIRAALEVTESENSFTEDDFIQSQEAFGRAMMTEFIDEITAAYDERDCDNILTLLRGFSFGFHLSDFNDRSLKIGKVDSKKATQIRSLGFENVVKFLYKIGMIGNQFDLRRKLGILKAENNGLFVDRQIH